MFKASGKNACKCLTSLLCPEGAALFERPPPHFSTAVYKAGTGEMLEVLPESEEVLPGPEETGQAIVRMKRYAVRLRHDYGVLRVITKAPDHKVAINNVLIAANAPRNAVISIKKLK